MAAAEQAEAPMLQYALDYLHAELPIFPVCSPLMAGHQHWQPERKRMEPCVNPGKTPLVRWRGYQLDLPSEDDVRIWWSQWPQANIGMATGELSGVLVLDADGTEARKQCLQRGGLDETPTVWTGKIGGAHFHLAYPDGANIRNFARKLAGTDLRAEGGYVLLPPSLHASGNRYRWAEGTQHIPPSAPPQWLLDLIAGSGEAKDGEWGEHDRFDVDEALKGFDQGSRNDGLFSFAGKLRRDDVPLAYAEILMQEAARNCRPAYDAAEAVAMVRRAYDEYPPGNASPTVEFDEEFSSPRMTAEPVTDPPPAVFFRPISELLAMPEVEPDWLVDQLFTVASNGWVAAEPKVGKSWVVLELAYALSTGQPFLGRFAIKQPRRVLYVQEEDSLQRVLRRLKKIIKGDPLRDDPSDDFWRWSIRQGFKLDNPVWIEMLRQEIESFSAEVVILDVFNRLHGAKENDQQEMTAILNTLISLSTRYGCSFIVVHHNRKPQQGDDARANQMIRGSGVLAGWAECSLYLKRSKDKDTIIVTPESKDSPEIDDFTVSLTDTDNGGICLQIGDAPEKTTLSKADQEVVEAVQTLTHRGIAATAMEVGKLLGKDRSTVQARLKRLTTAGYLTATPISDSANPTIIYKVVSQ